MLQSVDKSQQASKIDNSCGVFVCGNGSLHCLHKKAETCSHLYATLAIAAIPDQLLTGVRRPKNRPFLGVFYVGFSMSIFFKLNIAARDYVSLEI